MTAPSPLCTCSTKAGTRPADRHEPNCGVWDWDGSFKRKDRDDESFVWLVIHDCLASAGIDYDRAATAADILCDPVSGLTISVDGDGPRCQVRSCRDYGDPDFGEATCPSWHADVQGASS